MDTPLDYKKHAAEFREQGYTVIRGLLSKSEAAAFLAEVERCEGLDSNKAALNGNGIGFAGEIYLHSAFVRSVLTSHAVVSLVDAVAEDDLWVAMDQAVTKHPGAGVFRWHQDNGYNQLKCEHFQLWIALTETRAQNGALKLVPGSHKLGLLPHTFQGAGQMEFSGTIAGDHVTVDADAGDVILFSSLTLHCTGPNRADTKRVAYVAEYMRMSDYSPVAGPPYFIVTEDGHIVRRFTTCPPGAFSVRNQLLYLRPRLIAAIKKPVRYMRTRIRALLSPR